MSIPHSITGGSVIFIARGRPYPVPKGHPAFDRVRQLLSDPDVDPDLLIEAVDVGKALRRLSGGHAVIEEGLILLDGDPVPRPWQSALTTNPELVRILMIDIGDTIRVEGDEDAPDGSYEVKGTDDEDTERRIYVENDEEAFYGYVHNTSIKEIQNAKSS